MHLNADVVVDAEHECPKLRLEQHSAAERDSCRSGRIFLPSPLWTASHTGARLPALAEPEARRNAGRRSNAVCPRN